MCEDDIEKSRNQPIWLNFSARSVRS